MALSSINPYSTQFRIGGLASGLDTDQMVKDLMRVQRIPLDKIMQKKQLTEWKRDDYRNIINLLRGFKDGFFDVLKPSSNMKSQSAYQQYNAKSTDENVVTASGGPGVTGTSHTIIVNSIAEASNASSIDAVSGSMVSSAVSSFTVNNYNNTFTLNYNGVTRDIILPNGTYATAADIIGNGTDGLLLQKVKEAFNNNVDVVLNGSSIEFKTVNASDTLTVYSKSTADNLLSSVLKVNSSGAGSTLTFPINIEEGRKFKISMVEGGVTTTKELEWTAAASYADSNALAADINTKLAAAGIDTKVTVSGANSQLTFTKAAGVDSISFSESLKNDRIVQNLGFTSGDSNKLSLSDTLEKVSSKLSAGTITFDGSGNLKLTINGKDITAKKSETLSTLISRINSSDAGVTMSYSAYTDKFSLIAKKTGAGSITLNDNGSNFFANTRLTTVNPGGDASFVIDGLPGTRTSNTFTADGVTYNLLKADPGVEKTITLTQNTDTIFQTIKGFVDKYNEIIDTINNKLSEERSRDYLPLTDEQKNSMKDDDVKRWEEKAKTGLLRNDSLLQGIVYNMRKALSDGVSNVSVSLSSIGITTGAYQDKGKLMIDETKLKEAIKNNPNGIAELFTKQPDLQSNPSMTDTDKYNNKGLAYRLSDIIDNNIRTTRDSNGKKGVLLEKAGIQGDTTEFTSIMYNEIYGYDNEISKISNKLIDAENNYYKKFAAMEKALSQMNSQGSWLSSQLGGGNG